MLLQQLHRRDGLSKVEHDVVINIKMNFVGQLGNIFLFKNCLLWWNKWKRDPTMSSMKLNSQSKCIQEEGPGFSTFLIYFCCLPFVG